MGTLLIVVVALVLVMGGARILLGLKFQQEKLARKLSPAEEAQFEIVTDENVAEVLEHQIMKSLGEVTTDHPAYAARKIKG